MYDTDDFINIIRREIANAIHSTARGSTLLSVTAYNPATHAVKGIFQPHGVESNWMAIATPHATANGGVAVGPKVGSADKLDGDQMVVSFIGGDTDMPIAMGRLYSSAAPPLVVQEGEAVLQHASGTHVFLDKNGQMTALHGPSGNTFVMAKDNSLTMTHKASGSTIQIDKDGNHVHDTKGKALTITAATATLNGQPIKTGT